MMSPISTFRVAQILCSTVRVTSSSRRRRVIVFGAIPAALRKSALLIFLSTRSFQSLLYEIAMSFDLRIQILTLLYTFLRLKARKFRIVMRNFLFWSYLFWIVGIVQGMRGSPIIQQTLNLLLSPNCWYGKSSNYVIWWMIQGDAHLFEPTRILTLYNFESAPLWPLRYLSVSISTRFYLPRLKNRLRKNWEFGENSWGERLKYSIT